MRNFKPSPRVWGDIAVLLFSLLICLVGWFVGWIGGIQPFTSDAGIWAGLVSTVALFVLGFGLIRP